MRLKPGFNSYGNPIMITDGTCLTREHKGRAHTHACVQPATESLLSRLQGKSQLEFPNYTLIPGIAGELVGSDPTGSKLT